MNKKVVVIGSGIVLVLLVIVGVVFLINGNKGNEYSEETKQLAESIQGYMEGYSVEEIGELLEGELTDEQKNAMDDALISVAIPEYSEEVWGNSACISTI